MERKTTIQFSKQVGDKSLYAHFPTGCTYGEAYDFCMDMATHFIELINESAEKLARKEPENVDCDANQSSPGDSQDS